VIASWVSADFSESRFTDANVLPERLSSTAAKLSDASFAHVDLRNVPIKSSPGDENCWLMQAVPKPW
jgi:uncharacterized protein YjbI with pentapeptide repeats